MSAKRTCIKCDNDLDAMSVLDVEVDYCSSCGGIWLDDGEVKQLAAKPKEALAQVEAIEERLAQYDSSQAPPGDAGLDVPCPACGGKLTACQFGPTTIECCSRCSGIFLDRGELARTMELADDDAATTIAALARTVYTSGTIGGTA